MMMVVTVTIMLMSSSEILKEKQREHGDKHGRKHPGKSFACTIYLLPLAVALIAAST